MRTLLLLIPLILLANVSVSVNKKQLYVGEELVVSITASGHNIKFPTITKIDNEPIVGTSKSENINIINGQMSETITKSFILYPRKDITIPSFSVYVDGKLYKTKPIHIKVLTPKQTKGDFELDINVSKNNLYLGESAIFTIKFIQKSNAASIQIQRPQIPGFLLKQISSNEKEEGNTKILTYKFLIIPQKVGNYTIGPLIAQIGKIEKQNDNDFFGLQIAQITYQNIYSNTINIKVNPIPENSIYGDFNISINAKKKVKANEVNKVTLTIKGCGDFYSLNSINLTIPNVTIYPEKMKKKLFIKNNKLCGVAKETFNIIATNDYTIPSIILKTFDGKLKILKTKEIKVKVSNTKNLNIQKNIKTPTKAPQIHYKWFIIAIIISLTTGIIIGILIYLFYTKLKDEEIKAIKKANEKELINILKKYSDNEKIKEIIEKIEENIYKNTNNPINKKEIIKLIKQLRKKK